MERFSIFSHFFSFKIVCNHTHTNANEHTVRILRHLNKQFKWVAVYACCQFSHQGFPLRWISQNCSVFVFMCDCASMYCVCELHSSSQLQTELQCIIQDVTTLTRLKEQINKGFPTGIRQCVHLCVRALHTHVSFFVIGWVRARTTAQLVCFGPHTHAHTDTHVHAHTPTLPSAAAICAGNTAGKRGWEQKLTRG